MRILFFACLLLIAILGEAYVESCVKQGEPCIEIVDNCCEGLKCRPASFPSGDFTFCLSAYGDDFSQVLL